MNILFCGAGGSGKTTVVKDLRQKSKIARELPVIEQVARQIIAGLNLKQEDYKDNAKFLNLQKQIIDEQARQEQGHRGGFISDRCCIDALAYAKISGLADPVAEFSDCQSALNESFDLYRRSLVVLVYPLAECEDDGTRKVLSPDQSQQYTQNCEDLLQKYRIPFIKLKTRDREKRCSIMMDAVKGIQYMPINELKEAGVSNFGFNLPPLNGTAVPTLRIFEDRVEQSWTPEPDGKSSRFIARRGGVHGLYIISFDPIVRAHIAQKILLRGIRINGEVYTFLGCSSSGLKSRKCYVLKGSEADCHKALQENGDFDKIKSVSKRLARIGLLFSSVWLTGLEVEKVHRIPDITRGGHNFTDGCGKLSKLLVEDLVRVIREREAYNIPPNYNPVVFQIRFQGCKGVLTLDPTLEGRCITIRPSMEKFETNAHPQIGLCEYSKAYTFGHLNRQYITLLSGLGVPDEVFLSRQRYYLNLVKNMTHDAEAAVMLLQWQNKFQIATALLNVSSSSNSEIPKHLKDPIMKIQKSLLLKPEKLKILIPDSRNIFGVCDPNNVLNYGECFLRVTLRGKPFTIQGQVIVCKNPCYLLGDVRVLRAVDPASRPEVRSLEHLVDCIVFPTKGMRPHADEIAGSDLDGDNYFVCWDELLIPPHVKEPYGYPGAESRKETTITWANMIQYFTKSNRSVSLVDRFYRLWADRKGAGSQECERLGQLFSRAVDSTKTGEQIQIPPGLRIDPSDEVNDTNDYVWVKMTKYAEQFKTEFQEDTITQSKLYVCSEQITTDFVIDILNEEFSNVSEYDKFVFAWRHYSNIYKEDDYHVALHAFTEECLDYVNFSLFSLHEKWEAVSLGIPSAVIYNPLNKSHILHKEELTAFNMHHTRDPWHFHCRMNHNSLDWGLLTRALTNYRRVLLILQLPEQVKILIQFNDRMVRGEEQKIEPGAVEAFLFSEHFGQKKRYCIGMNYTMDLKDDLFQIYRGHKSRTFIWFNCKEKFWEETQNFKKPDSVQNSISVDLSRFDANIYRVRNHPKVNKTAFSCVEVFVGDAEYLDIIEGNFLDDVVEIQLEEDEDEVNDAEVNIEIPTQELDLRDLIKWLTEVKSGGRLTIPQSELQTFVEGSLISHEEDLREFSLDQMIELFVLCSRLDLNDTMKQASVRLEDSSINVGQFIDTLLSWQAWWYLARVDARDIIGHLFHAVEIKDQLDAYFTHYAVLRTLALIEEMEPSKAIRETLNETPENLANLIIESNPTSEFDKESEKLTVILYRTASLHVKSKMKRGQFVVVSRQAAPSVNFLGKVQSFTEAPVSIEVQVVSKVVPSVVKLCLLSSKKIYWRMSLVGNVAAFTSSLNAMRKLLDATPIYPMLSVLDQPGAQPKESPLYKELEFSPPGILPDLENLEDMPHLNVNQKKAVMAGLSQVITLIQGPPGTGKTTVACEIVKQACKSQISGVLVCAETNNAVDNITRKLASAGQLKLLRLGHDERISPDLIEFSLDGQLRREAAEEAKLTQVRSKEGFEFRKPSYVRRLVNKAEVVLTTCASANDPNLEHKTFDLVVCDEATLTQEPTLLCALVHKPKKVILIGDPNQLGPMDVSTPDEPKDDLPRLSLLSTTLFHRLHQQTNFETHFLNVQHRMHPALMKFPSDEFYNGKLISGVSEQDRPAPHFPWPDRSQPLCFLPSEGEERHVRSSYSNEDEANLVLKCVKRILHVDEEEKGAESRPALTSREIGIITPYRGQVKCIKDKLQDFQQIEVNSVDGFQGREKELIIVSSVRSNNRQILGFTDDRNRMNVMLTRARSGFILIGNHDTLCTSETWRKWLQQAPRLEASALEIRKSDDRDGKRGPGHGGRFRGNRGRGPRSATHNTRDGGQGDPRQQQERELDTDNRRSRGQGGSRSGDHHGRRGQRRGSGRGERRDWHDNGEYSGGGRSQQRDNGQREVYHGEHGSGRDQPFGYGRGQRRGGRRGRARDGLSDN